MNNTNLTTLNVFGKTESFEWKKKWNKVLDWNFDEPKVKWFSGGQLNITENCLDST